MALHLACINNPKETSHKRGSILRDQIKRVR